MTSALNHDLEKLKNHAFDRAEWAQDTLRRYHAAFSRLGSAAPQSLTALYRWMFVPPTLWPFNIQDVLDTCLTAVEAGKRLNPKYQLLIDLLPEPPDETVCH